MSAYMATAGSPFQIALPQGFHLAGDKLVGVKKILAAACEAFMKKVRAIYTLKGKPLLQAAATMIGRPELLGDMTNMIAGNDLKKTGPPNRPWAPKLRALFPSLKR